jgi:hypothetical protein
MYAAGVEHHVDSEDTSIKDDEKLVRSDKLSDTITEKDTSTKNEEKLVRSDEFLDTVVKAQKKRMSSLASIGEILHGTHCEETEALRNDPIKREFVEKIYSLNKEVLGIMGMVYKIAMEILIEFQGKAPPPSGFGERLETKIREGLLSKAGNPEGERALSIAKCLLDLSKNVKGELTVGKDGTGELTVSKDGAGELTVDKNVKGELTVGKDELTVGNPGGEEETTEL